jgi:membrane protein
MRTYFTILKRAAKSFGEHKGTSFAAAIAYNAIFSIFPLVLLAIAFLGFFLHNPQQRQSAVDALFGVFGSSVSKDALRTQVNAVAGGSVAVGIFGILAAAWSATGVFDQIRSALQIIWDSTKDRPVVQQKLIDVGMLGSVGLLILLSLAATAVLTAFERFGTQLVGRSLSGGVQLLFATAAVAVPTALSFCAFSLLYWLVPDADIRLKNVWFGALVAALALEIVQLLFASYVASFGHYSQTYGTLGGIIAFLFFIYVAGCIILFGSEIAKEHIDVLTGMKSALDPAEPKPKQSILAQAEGLVKGLVVDASSHHDTSLPDEPGRDTPVDPAARLVTNQQSHQGSAPATQARERSGSAYVVASDGQNADGMDRLAMDGRPKPGTPIPEGTVRRAPESSPVGQEVGMDGTGSSHQWETAVVASVAFLTSFGLYELLHQFLGFRLPFVERWKAKPTKR